jgi:hypothetical protein
MTTEIETVTVTAKEFRENLDYYVELMETTRVVLMHGDEPMMAVGPWLPDEQRFLPPLWFWEEIFPPEPVDRTNRASRAILEDRGIYPST